MFSFLPTGLGDAGDLTFGSQFTEADTAQLELTDIRSGTAAGFAAGVFTNFELVRFERFNNQTLLCHSIEFLLLFRKRDFHHFEKLESLFVALGIGDHRNVDTQGIFQFVGIDFSEN